MYEDIPVMVPMHYLCNKVAVVNKVGYYWRVRDGVTKSITQNTKEKQNFEDRLTVIGLIDEFFKENVTEQAIIDEKIYKILDIDFFVTITNLPKVSDELYDFYTIKIKEYINNNIDKRYFEKLSVEKRQIYEYLLSNNKNALISLLKNRKEDYLNAPIIEKDKKFYIECSDDLFTIANRDVTEELKRGDVLKNISGIFVKNNVINLTGYLYLPRLNIPDFDSQKVKAYLYNENTEVLTPIYIQPKLNNKITKSKGFVVNLRNKKEYQYNYDGTGFEISFNLEKINFSKSNLGKNRVLLKYENRLLSGSEFLSCNNKAMVNKIEETVVFLNDKSLRLTVDFSGQLVCTLKKEKVFAKNVSFDERKIKIVLSKNVKELFAVSPDGIKIPFKKGDKNSYFSDITNFKFEENYKFFVTYSGITERLIRKAKKVNFNDLGNMVAIARSNKTLFLEVMFIPSCSAIISDEKIDNTVKLKTKSVGNFKDLTNVVSAQLIVYEKSANVTEILSKIPCKIDNNKIYCDFEIDFSNSKLTGNLYNGYKDIFIEYITADGVKIRQTLFAEKYFKFVMEFDTLLVELYRGILCGLRLYIKRIRTERESDEEK